jgi:hypothetical protein
MKLEFIGKERKENNQERNKTKNNNEEATFLVHMQIIETVS